MSSSTKKRKKKDKATAKDWRTSSPVAPQVPEAKPHLFSLPTELRNQIYELAVLEDHPITAVWLKHHWQRQSEVKLVQQPGIAQACRQLRGEVLPIFYGGNTFNTIFHAGAWHNDGQIQCPDGIRDYRHAQEDALMWWLRQVGGKGVTRLLVHTDVEAREFRKHQALGQVSLFWYRTDVFRGWHFRYIKRASAWKRHTDCYMDVEPDHYWLIKDEGAWRVIS